MANKKSDPQFAVGDKIKINMHAPRIVDATIKAIIDSTQGVSSSKTRSMKGNLERDNGRYGLPARSGSSRLTSPRFHCLQNRLIQTQAG